MHMCLKQEEDWYMESHMEFKLSLQLLYLILWGFQGCGMKCKILWIKDSGRKKKQKWEDLTFIMVSDPHAAALYSVLLVALDGHKRK